MTLNTAIAAFGLSPKQQLSLTVAQCLLQGLLASLCTTFLTTASTRPRAFTAYVIIVNLLCLGQTTISVNQAFGLLDPNPYIEWLPLVYVAHTVVIGTGVQAFFMHRCWNILKKRVLLIIPLLALCLIAFSAGIIMVVFKSGSSEANLAYHANLQDQALQLAFNAAERRTSIAMATWAFSSFVLDLAMTLITIVFLCRMRSGMPGHVGILYTVWQLLWASVAPPLILMGIVVIDGYITTESPNAVSGLALGIIAKFFALSLMINLVGQGYIREKFERVCPVISEHPSHEPGAPISNTRFASIVVSVNPSLGGNSDSDDDAGSTSTGILEAHDAQQLDIEKYQVPATPPPSVEACHHPRQVHFST